MTLRDSTRAVGGWVDRYLLRFTVVALVAAFFFVLLAPRILVTIPAGHRGVLWDRFGGTRLSRTYGEGLHVVWPWNVMIAYNVRYQTDTREYSVVDDQGLEFTIELSTRYRADVGALGRLHALVGPSYLEVLIVPEVASHVRGVVATMHAQDVYSRLRLEIEKFILKRVQTEISVAAVLGEPETLVHVEDILLRTIKLPPLVAAAIAEKVRQYHMVEEWQFRRTREEIEAERMRLEGRGVRNFQAEAGGSLTDQYLRLKGIEATLKLAESPNAKTIIIGSGQQGLPVILGQEALRPVPGPPVPSRPGAPATTPPARSSLDEKKRDIPPTPLAAPSAPPPTGAPSAQAPRSPTAEPGWLGGIVNRLGRLVGR